MAEENKGNNLTPINETTTDAKWADIKMAIGLAIVWATGLVTGWYLTASGFFG